MCIFLYIYILIYRSYRVLTAWITRFRTDAESKSVYLVLIMKCCVLFSTSSSSSSTSTSSSSSSSLSDDEESSEACLMISLISASSRPSSSQSILSIVSFSRAPSKASISSFSSPSGRVKSDLVFVFIRLRIFLVLDLLRPLDGSVLSDSLPFLLAVCCLAALKAALGDGDRELLLSAESESESPPWSVDCRLRGSCSELLTLSLVVRWISVNFGEISFF